MLPPIEVIRETEIGQRIEEIGRYAGLREGRQEGLREGRRTMLHEALLVRFPDLGIPESALPIDEAALKTLVGQMLRISDPDEMRRVIREAAHS